MTEFARNGLRRDLRLIADLVEANARVLDVGCGDGALLAHLARTSSRLCGVGNSQSELNEMTQKRAGAPRNALASTPPCEAARSK